MMNHHDIIGLIGVALALIAYGGVQWHRDFAKNINYSLLNLVNACCLIYSLLDKWNPAAFISNIIWASISLYGIYRCMKYKGFFKKT